MFKTDPLVQRDAVQAEPMLSGVRVLEIGHFVAAPFCTRLLADLGADVIKIEPPAGDPVRQWGEHIDGNSLWWSMHGRNKRSFALDLKSPDAKRIVLELVSQCDVLVENFRPGALEKLGLGLAVLRAARPGLIVAQISGFGQTGPRRDEPAFGVIGEAMGGLRYLTNHPAGMTDLPPVRVGVSIGDSISGLYAAFGVVAALYRRDCRGTAGAGFTVDVALTDSILSMMEGMLPEYGALNKIKQPTGGAISTAAPTNAYPTKEGLWVLIAANSQPLFERLARLVDEPALRNAVEFGDNRARVANSPRLDAIIGAWTKERSAIELIDLLTNAGVPNCRVYTAADCATDPHFRERGMVREVFDAAFGHDVLHAGIVPHIKEAPGQIRWPGPSIGQHNDEISRELLNRDSVPS